MRFKVHGATCRGNGKTVNRDGLIVKYGEAGKKECLMAVICGGIGGVLQGEYISNEVIRTFSEWYDMELPEIVERGNLSSIEKQWTALLEKINDKIFHNALEKGISAGTTFTGIFFINDEYVITHVGDSGIYHLGRELSLLTEDQIFTHKNTEDGKQKFLLQCIGASEKLSPDIIYGKRENGIYILCTDSMKRQCTKEDFSRIFPENKQYQERDLKECIDNLFRLLKDRGERDTMSAIVILT